MSLLSRPALALFTAGAAVVSLAVSAGAERPAAEMAPPPLAASADVSAMLDLEAKMADQMHYGIVTPVTFADASQTPGTVVGTGSWGDSGLWSGVYLGGEALRYRTAQHYLSLPSGDPGKSSGRGRSDDAPGHLTRDGLTDEEREFWTAQRDDALAHVRAVLESEHRDINISASWTGTLKVPPSVNTGDPTKPGDNKHLADFGGGIIHGEAGMMQRACTPSDAGAMGVSPPSVDPNGNTVNDHNNRVYAIKWLKTDGGDDKTYWCETSPSRDTYAGVTFGLLTAYDMVSTDFPEMRRQITQDLLALGNFLLKYGWNYPRPTGYVANPGANDFDGFLSPLFVYVPMARLNLTNAVRHVADLSGTSADQTKWDAVWAEELASQGPSLASSMLIDSAQPNNGYYKFNLHHLAGFNLLRTLSGPERDLVLRSIAVMDKTTADDLNAHFEAITYSQTGESSRLDAAVQHLREWRDYRAYTGAGNLVDHRGDCGSRFACITDDSGTQVIVDGGAAGPVTVVPARPQADPKKVRALYARPVAERPPTDFLWQRPSTALTGQEPANYREPGIDYLTPYWMLRYYTEVAPPASTPMPTFAGPAFL